MNETVEKWIEAAKVLGRDPSAEVPCPVCGVGVLEVQDISFPGSEEGFERYLRCPLCGAVNIMRMRRKSSL